MNDSSSCAGRATTPQVRADDVELETLLRRAAEFLTSRPSPTEPTGSATRITSVRGRDSET